MRISWFGNSQVAANLSSQKFVDFVVPRHSGAEISRRVSPPRMIGTFADEHAALRGQIPD
jgi:hypothetical protein